MTVKRYSDVFDKHLRDDENIIWVEDLPDVPSIIRDVAEVILDLSTFISIISIPIFGCLLFIQFSNPIVDNLFVVILMAIMMMVVILVGKWASENFQRGERYAITNHRILLKTLIGVNDVPFKAMQNVEKTIYENGEVDINLYASESGQQSTPIATLKNLSQKDAETAYDLLVEIRDIFLEEVVESPIETVETVEVIKTVETLDTITLFDDKLREDEYIIWQGQVATGNNYLHPLRYGALATWFAKNVILNSILVLIAIGILAFILRMVLLSQFWKFVGAISLVVFFITPFVVLLQSMVKSDGSEKTRNHESWHGKPLRDVLKIETPIKKKVQKKVRKRVRKPRSTIPNPWIKNRYVITNQRVLLYEDGRFQETSLILMQDAVKTKPRNGQSNINLYDRRSPTGQLPAPIATLNNLSEEDAETAYDLLVKARDLSFEERIEDMGFE